jgi:hypothetical protein
MIYLSNLKPSPYDSRDYLYPEAFATATLPPRVDLRAYAGEIEDQGVIGSCTANSTVSALELILKRAGKYENLSRLFLYYTTREYENRIGQDGAVLRDALKMANKRGLPLESSYQYNISAVDKKPSPFVYKEAKQRLVSSYEAVRVVRGERASTINNIKAALAAGHPVVIALRVFNYIFSIKGPLETHGRIDTTKPGNLDYVGNHAATIVGYDTAVFGGMFIVENSWGASWGDNGYWGMPFTGVDNIYEAWVIKGFNEIGEDYSPAKVRVNQLYAALFGRGAEKGGLDYWVNQLSSMSAPEVAQIMYGVEPARVYYPTGITNQQLIEKFYINVLGRYPDDGGLAFWANRLDSGQSVGQVVVDIVDVLATYTGDNPLSKASQDLFNNKVRMGLYTSVSLASDNIDVASVAFNGLTRDEQSVYTAKSNVIDVIGY